MMSPFYVYIDVSTNCIFVIKTNTPPALTYYGKIIKAFGYKASEKFENYDNINLVMLFMEYADTRDLIRFYEEPTDEELDKIIANIVDIFYETA